VIDLQKYNAWFVTGSQHLYGPEVLETVASHAREMAQALSASSHVPVDVVYKPVLTTPEAVRRLCLDANADDACVGLITWMHTFSPAKMWIAGLKALDRPIVHLHTQHGREIPWADIDMDFMNLHQSAHGDREFGHLATRLGLSRKVVVGYWRDEEVRLRLGAWARAACARRDAAGARVARFGDNMRDVAVTEGDKVEAQVRFGYDVYGFGVGDLVARVNAVGNEEIEALIADYAARYRVRPELLAGGARRDSLWEGARIEAGLRSFLTEGGFDAFTTTFEDLHGLAQLPGLAVQRLMADGYGFGAEGDWKTAALLRAMKVMAAGLEGGTSFMEDYTYHMADGGMKVLGAHMLEVCPTIAEGEPSLEVHPLSIGGKDDPVRLVFDARPGPAVNASVVDLGGRFRMVVNEVDVIPTDEPLPKLPVARALWLPRPDLKTAATAWILAGGAHHTGLSQALTVEHLEDWADMVGIEMVLIDGDTTVRGIKNELRWNEAFFGATGTR
jgi:L-arabinose isomerase